MELYKGIAGSPITYLSSDISANQTTISIADDSALPDGPNICTIGYGEHLETIKYETKSNGVLQNVTRGIEGTPRAWQAGTEVARFFTAYDHNSIIENFNSHLAEKATQNILGHVKAGEGASIDVNGILTTGGFKVVNFGRDISLAGEQIVSSVGFRPRFVLFTATIPGVAGNMSIGFGDLTTHVSLSDFYNRTANAYDIVPNEICFYGVTGVDARAVISAFSENGFILTWTKSGNPTGNANINAVCFK